MTNPKIENFVWSSFMQKYSRLIIICLFALALLCSVTALGMWWFQLKQDTIATVNGEKITKSDYSKEYENFSKKAAFMEEPSINSPENIKKYLVERKILDIAARDYSITVSEGEIEKEIDRNKTSFNNDLEQLKTSYEDAYGLDSEELNKSVYYNLLKEKVSKKVVATKTGKYLYARYGTANGVEALAGVPTEKLDPWAQAKISTWTGQLDAGADFLTLYDQVVAEAKYPAYYGSDFIEDSYSESSSELLKSLDSLKVGEYSAPIKLDGFYAVYYLTEKNDGQYRDWDAFIKDYSEKYVKYSLQLNSKLSFTLPKNNFLKMVATNVFGLREAFASCAQCSGCNGYRVYGYISDSLTGDAVVGTISGTSASSDFCEGSTSSSKVAWCGYRSASDRSDAAGYYNIARRDGAACNFNCAGGTVTLTATATNYSDIVVTKNGTNGSYVRQDFHMVPDNRTLKVNISPASSGTVSGTGISCGADCTQVWGFSGPSTTITATAAAGYVFDHWEAHSGNLTYTDPHTRYTPNPLGVNHAANWSITAVFTVIPPSNFTLNVGVQTDTNRDGIYEPTSVGGNATWATSRVCPGDCTSSWAAGAWVDHRGTANGGYEFVGWDVAGDQVYPNNPINILMNSSKQVTARFRALPTPPTPVLNVGIVTDTNNDGIFEPRSDGGTVTTIGAASPYDINCPTPKCTATYRYQDAYDIIANPVSGATFIGWSFQQPNGPYYDGSGDRNADGSQEVIDTTTIPGIPLHKIQRHGIYFDRSWNVTAHYRLVPALTCNVIPTAGVTPLVVRVNSVITNVVGGTFSYDVQGGSDYEYTGRGSSITHTYLETGVYTVRVLHSPSGLSAFCSPGPVTVGSPTGGSGGEVSPN